MAKAKNEAQGGTEAPEMKIEWRDVPICEGYAVNSLGEVWSKERNIEKSWNGRKYIAKMKGKKLKAWKSNAYLYCSLGRSTRCSVHRLICMAFHGMPKNKKLEVAHLDGNPENNTPENLVWATPAENEQMKKQHGTYYVGRGAHFQKPWHKKRGPKRTIHPEAHKMAQMRNSGATWKEIAETFGMSTSGVYGVIKYRSGGM